MGPSPRAPALLSSVCGVLERKAQWPPSAPPPQTPSRGVSVSTLLSPVVGFSPGPLLPLQPRACPGGDTALGGAFAVLGVGGTAPACRLRRPPQLVGTGLGPAGGRSGFRVPPAECVHPGRAARRRGVPPTHRPRGPGRGERAPPHSSSAEALDRLLPPVGAGRAPRKRTTSQCKSEPPLLRTSKRTIYTAGRPPWYNEHGAQSKEAFAIGERRRLPPRPVGWRGGPRAGRLVAQLEQAVPSRRPGLWARLPAPLPRAGSRRPGGRQRVWEDHRGQDDHRGPGRALGGLAVHGLLLQGEGATSLCRLPPAPSPGPRAGLRPPPALPQVLTRQQQEQAALNNYNFDHPDAFDFDLIVATLQKLKQGKSVKVPVYDFTTHSRKKDWVGPAGSGCQGRRGVRAGDGSSPLQKTLYGANVIIFEGIMAFADKTLLEVRAGSRPAVLLGTPPAGLTWDHAGHRSAWAPVLSRGHGPWTSGEEWSLSVSAAPSSTWAV